MYVVAGYVDIICIFVSCSDSDFLAFIWQKMSIIRFQRPCWAIKNWEGIVGYSRYSGTKMEAQSAPKNMILT